MNRICLGWVIVCLFAGSVHAEQPAIELWGLVEARDLMGAFEAIREFERRTGIHVIVGTPGGQGDLDPQKLLTAIISRTPPDVVWFGRHNTGLWAPRNSFRPLDDLIQRDHIDLTEYYPGAIGESQWEGKTYALPWNVDCRVLFCNMTCLREKGFQRPPETWDELEQMAAALTTFNAPKNRYDLLGYAPNYGNSWLYLYAWQLGAKWISEDGRKALVTAPEVVQALDYMVKLSDAVGGAERIQAFAGSSQMEGIGDPFLSGRLAMQINGNYVLDHIARLKPDLDFEVALPPAPKNGMPPVSWTGGFSWVIPTDARHPDAAWEFIKWMNSEEAWRVQSEAQIRYAKSTSGPNALFVPHFCANRVINETITRHYTENLPEKFRKANEICLALLPYCKFRPVTPACSELWDAQEKAFINASFHESTPLEALTVLERRVQSALDRFYKPKLGPLLSARWIVTGVTIIVLCLIAAAMSYFLHGLRRYSRLERKNAWRGVAYAAPWMAGFLVLVIGPMIYSLVMAFTRYDVLHPPEFIGWSNWTRMFGVHFGPEGILANDPLFWKSLWNTFFMTLFGVPIGMMVSLGIAMLLNTNVRGMGLYRTLYYIPVMVPAVASALIWMWLLNPETGFVNYFLAPPLHRLGLRAPSWFADATWAKPGMILLLTWGCGGTVIIWLAGLQTLPRHLYEAAMIDGASPWARFRHITLPLLTPYILFNWIMGTIASLQIFTQAYILSGPADSTLFYVVYLFLRAFRYFEMGYACAMAWVLFLITAAMCLWQIRVSKRWTYYAAE
ncbi:MAG TPA: extracellular solute-binding protein [Candidatus Hydrogenedentes bacterium]|nr:extracellular solute-binding protein [Candidatus Hydrogenedentota bacterium]